MECILNYLSAMVLHYQNMEWRWNIEINTRSIRRRRRFISAIFRLRTDIAFLKTLYCRLKYHLCRHLHLQVLKNSKATTIASSTSQKSRKYLEIAITASLPTWQEARAPAWLVSKHHKHACWAREHVQHLPDIFQGLRPSCHSPLQRTSHLPPKLHRRLVQ